MKRLALIIAILAADALSGQVGFAAPSVSSIQGTFGNRQAVTIQGAGFGTKSPAAPYVWADFESSINPSAGGLQSSWSQVQSLVWTKGEGWAGSGCAKASDGDGTYTLRSDYDAWTRDGQTLYIHKKQRRNFLINDISQNWKVWRMWTSSNAYPDIYIAENNGRVFVENVSSGDSGFFGSFPITTTNWVTTEIIFRASTIDQKNGFLQFRHDGRTVAEGAVQTRSSAWPDYMTLNYVFHEVLANVNLWSPGWSSNNRVWVDDVYVDTTWSRVMIGNAPTFRGSTHFEIQLPISWSQNSVSIIAHTGTFSKGSRAYVYVFDKDNQVNSNGFLVTVGQSGNAAAPAVVSLVANAGPDVVAAINSDASLKGSVAANNAASGLSVQWTLESGPGLVTFANSRNATTKAKFSQPGQYVLQLAASNGPINSVDTVTVEILPSVAVSGVQPKNVFNPASGENYRILCLLSEPGSVSADIIDRTGRRVRSLDGGDRPAGEQYLEWDGRNESGEVVASGIYVVFKKCGGQHSTTKVAVIK